ncbi:MAG: late competence development ComFB family protein [Treponema sp.]|jgi:competence protein ComFB|nr:late competence development ComFB family protein [Treponema sp.]
MDIHNTSEDVVFGIVQNIFEEIQNTGNPDNLCLCYQCRMDTICYTLNRVEPHYIVSNRGFSRLEHHTGVKRQQTEADITSLSYRGIRLVNHNMRPTAPHDGTNTHQQKFNQPLFDIPTISGRIFNGESFEPITGIDVSLYLGGDLVEMRNNNWQNPYTMVPSTPGVFSFWPAPIHAELPDISQVFNFSLKIYSQNYEPLNHFFNISTISKFHTPNSYTLNRTFKLPDLYLFPPGDGEMNGEDI